MFNNCNFENCTLIIYGDNITIMNCNFNMGNNRACLEVRPPERSIMTREEFKGHWYSVTGDRHFSGKFWKKFRDTLRELPSIGYVRDFIQEHNMKFKEACIAECQPTICTNTYYPPILLGTCTTAATPCTQAEYLSQLRYMDSKQEQGNNPMRAYSDTTATAISITTSDAGSESKEQRQYLLRRFEDITRAEWREDSRVALLRDMFNIHAPIAPKTSKELLDAMKNGKYTVDQAKVDAQTKFFAAEGDDRDDLWSEDINDRYYGITFTDLPVADMKGYNAAYEAYRKLVQDTRDSIMIGTPAEGLAALRAFELWMPEQNAPSTTTTQ